jgi:hypothetical protein
MRGWNIFSGGSDKLHTMPFWKIFESGGKHMLTMPRRIFTKLNFIRLFSLCK